MSSKGMSINRNQRITLNKPRTSSKIKQNTFLPNINKTVFFSNEINKNKLDDSLYTTKIQWLLEKKDYDQLSDEEIISEYNSLRKQLLNINENVMKAIYKSQNQHRLKSVQKEKDPAKVLQLKQKQIQINSSILDLTKKQYEKLTKRIDSVSSFDNKKNLDIEIQTIKEQIVTIKDKIKNLKLKSNKIGNSIISTDDLFEQIRQLEYEKEIQLARKNKLQFNVKKCQDNIKQTLSKIQNINNECQKAQRFFHTLNNTELQEVNIKLNEKNYNHKKQKLEILKKKIESINQSSQLKYHDSLKHFETTTEKQKQLQKSIREVEASLIESKDTITSLQQLLARDTQLLKQRQKDLQPSTLITQIKFNDIVIQKIKATNDTNQNIQQKPSLNQINSNSTTNKINDRKGQTTKQNLIHVQDIPNLTSQFYDNTSPRLNINLSPINIKKQTQQLSNNKANSSFFQQGQ